MKNKGFTLVELIVVIAVISILMLIGVPAFAQIVERVKVRSDKVSAAEIGKAICIREIDVKEDKRVPYYPTVVRYDNLERIEEYLSKEYRPQSMKDGYFFVTALQIEGIKRILVGIGKKEMPVTDVAYNSSKQSGWVYIESCEISDFLETNKSMLSETVTMPEDYPKEEKVSGNSDGKDNDKINLEIGQYVEYRADNPIYTVTYDGSNSSFNPRSTNVWQVYSTSGENIALISANSVGDLTLSGKDGYKNAVGILNSIARAYVDNDLVVSARSAGSGAGSIEVINEGDSPITWEATYKSGKITSSHRDNLFKTDRDIIKDNASLHCGKDIWLASRFVDATEEHTYFSVRSLSRANVDGAQSLYISRETTNEELTPVTLGVRPIIYLSNDTKIAGGHGTINSMYTLSK